MEHPFPVGALVEPHLYKREDEYSIVLEGEIGFRSGNRDGGARTGSLHHQAARRLHAMWNAGKTPARMIEVISPAGFGHFFREMADMLAAGPPFDEADQLAASYGLTFGEPDWLADVIARYDLKPDLGG